MLIIHQPAKIPSKIFRVSGEHSGTAAWRTVEVVVVIWEGRRVAVPFFEIIWVADTLP
jgi:hypothetical protein